MAEYLRKNKRNNQERYVRIAFESLEDFIAKQNRKNYLLINENSQELNPIFSAIKDKNFDTADQELKELIKNISNKIYQLEYELKSYSFDSIDNFSSMVAEPSEK